MKRMKVYDEWLLKFILKLGHEKAILVLQSEAVGPNYRDTPAPYVFDPMC